jgi:hypothetical protein
MTYIFNAVKYSPYSLVVERGLETCREARRTGFLFKTQNGHE